MNNYLKIQFDKKFKYSNVVGRKEMKNLMDRFSCSLLNPHDFHKHEDFQRNPTSVYPITDSGAFLDPDCSWGQFRPPLDPKWSPIYICPGQGSSCFVNHNI